MILLRKGLPIVLTALLIVTLMPFTALADEAPVAFSEEKNNEAVGVFLGEDELMEEKKDQEELNEPIEENDESGSIDELVEEEVLFSEIESEAGSNAVTTEEMEALALANDINYQTHVQDVGWQTLVKGGGTSGTSGRSLRLEGIKISLENSLPGDVIYSTHVQNIGWQSEVKNGAMSGTTGRSLRLEAITIRLSGEIADSYSVYYRVHAQNIGWMGWAKDGESAGTAGYSYRLEAIQILLVPVEGNAPQNDSLTKVSSAFYDASSIANYMGYSSFLHIQNIGDRTYNDTDGSTIMGTSRRYLRLEAFSIQLNNTSGISGSIEYRTHVQNIGWQSWMKDGTRAGTSGRSLRLEALQIKLTGEIAAYYDIYYQVHVQNIGWQGWVSNGNTAGTNGQSLRLEAMRIAIIKKGTPPPPAIAVDAGESLSTRETIVYFLESLQGSNYYLTTPYTRGALSYENNVYPNGSPRWDGYVGMNCCGFVLHVFRNVGANPAGIESYNKGSMGASATGAWQPWLDRNARAKYAFGSVSELLASGRAEKGDLILFMPNNWYMPNADSHLGFFWGDTPGSNVFWHSDAYGNRISDIRSSTPNSTVYLYKY